MSDRVELLQKIEEALPVAIGLLLEERDGAGDVPAGPQAQWDLFRALVNMRTPVPASEELIVSQNRLLQGILEYRGTATLDDIEPVEGRGSIRLWRGDITTLGVDAIVNAANSQMLGCFVPGHHCIDNAIHTFAGIQLRLECARLMEEQGYPEPTGMAKVTSAFNLPSRRIIHTVGPIARGKAPCSRIATRLALTPRQVPGARPSPFAASARACSGFPRKRRRTSPWARWMSGSMITITRSMSSSTCLGRRTSGYTRLC